MFEDKIFSHFTEIIPELHKKFDDNHKSEIRELAEYVSKIYVILGRVLNCAAQSKITDVEFAITMLLWRGVNSIIASFELIRSGYGIEPLVVARNALETCTTAIDFYKNPKKFEVFQKKKYKSSKSIDEAKKVIPAIGKFYGALTNFYSHISLFSSYPLYNEDDTGAAFLATGGVYGEDNEFNLNMNLSLISFLLSIYLASVEYIFFKFCKKSEFWRSDNINKLKFNPIKEERERNKKREKKILRAFASLDVTEK